jgi:hypothetical protein
MEVRSLSSQAQGINSKLTKSFIKSYNSKKIKVGKKIQTIAIAILTLNNRPQIKVIIMFPCKTRISLTSTGLKFSSSNTSNNNMLITLGTLLLLVKLKIKENNLSTKTMITLIFQVVKI